jgi:predicted PurR-regulated permease PerM
LARPLGTTPQQAGSLLRVGVILLALVGGALLVARLQELVVVLLIAVVLAEGLRPVVDGLERRGIPRGLARALLYVAIVAVLATVFVVLTRPVVTESRAVLADLPRYQALFERNLAQLLDQLSLDPSVASQVAGSAGGIARGTLSFAATLLRGVLDTVVILLLSFLWLTAGRPLGGFLLGLLPPSGRTRAASVWAEIARGFAGYVRGIAINMIVIGVVTGVAAALLGLPAPALLGVFAGVTEMIPIVGPIAGAIPAILLGFTISPYYPLLVALVYLVIQQIEAHTLVPLVMRHSVGLPALAVVVALAAGGALAGVGGAIVAVPLAFALQVVIVRVIGPAIRTRTGADSAT